MVPPRMPLPSSRIFRELGSGILGGTITVNPYEQGGNQACTYCAYQSVCGFDSRVGGYGMRKLPKLSGEDALEYMRREVDEEAPDSE